MILLLVPTRRLNIGNFEKQFSPPVDIFYEVRGLLTKTTLYALQSSDVEAYNN